MRIASKALDRSVEHANDSYGPKLPASQPLNGSSSNELEHLVAPPLLPDVEGLLRQPPHKHLLGLGFTHKGCELD